MARFYKLQAVGNDFICFNYDDVKKYNLKIFSKFICDRHFGVGADGLILFSKGKTCDFVMKVFNKDGTENEMCANGICCLAKFLYEKGYTDKAKITIETFYGKREAKYILENKKVMAIRVNMGRPIIDINRLPIYVPRNYRHKEDICKLAFRLQDKEDSIGIFLRVGNPHTVIRVDDVKNIQVTKYGRIVENYKYFPHKTDVEFIQIVDENNIKIRVWNRGVGELLSSGTGAVAACYAMYKEKMVCDDINVESQGGKLRIQIDKSTEQVILEEAAINVFEGEIDL